MSIEEIISEAPDAGWVLEQVAELLQDRAAIIPLPENDPESLALVWDGALFLLTVQAAEPVVNG